MPDIDINCIDCNNNFLFPESEQAFYEEKGFTQPKRCKPCRDARKANGGGSGERGGGGPRRDRSDRPAPRSDSRGGGGGRGDDRPMFDAVCGDCGASTSVPFQPKADRPVYCRDCFRARSPR